VQRHPDLRLFSDTQICELGLGPDGFIARARPGTVVVSHTTGTADHIAEGNLTVLIGGPADAVDRVTPVLAAYASPIIATGGAGSALTIKLINNVLFAANSQLVAAAVAAAEQAGADLGYLQLVIVKGPLELLKTPTP
jgi:3-hydroxyisobutyrate dehydrogenase-like beta-hydroxyacid dehydrogenase